MIAASMRKVCHFQSVHVLLAAGLSLSLSCRKTDVSQVHDNPRTTPNVSLRDIRFRSAALDRYIQYRVIFPSTSNPAEKLQAVYLLHGGGGGFRDWSNYSDVARFAEAGFILIMPEGQTSYYTNSFSRPQDRYEDYIVNDLIADAEARFPADRDRSHRAIVGISMGAFGAIIAALKHPELFAFAAGLSPALDVASRPFSIKRVSQYYQHRQIFGPWGIASRRNNDPFVLVRSVDPNQTPYLYLSVGNQEGLLVANRRFANILAERKFQFEFHTVPGGHDWNQWNARLDECFHSLLNHLK